MEEMPDNAKLRVSACAGTIRSVTPDLVGKHFRASRGRELEPGDDPQYSLLNPPESEGSDPVED